MLAEHAEFHVNINSVVGGGFKDPNDALVIGKRALELGFESTIGIIHDGDGQLKPLKPDEAKVYFEMTNRKKTNYAQFDAFQEAIVQGRENEWRCRAGSRYLYICEDGLVHYCSQQRGYPGVPLARVHDRGCEAGVFDGEELRAELHDWMRAPHQPHRPLEGSADQHSFAGAAGRAGEDTALVNSGQWSVDSEQCAVNRKNRGLTHLFFFAFAVPFVQNDTRVTSPVREMPKNTLLNPYK